jgi:lipopolysaccharide exporter
MISLSRRFINAVQWNVAMSAATILAQLGITAVLARLLSPAAFGLFAIANVAFVMGRHLGELGLISSIIREPVLDSEIFGSAVVLSCLLSAALTFFGMLLAPLAGLGAALGERSVLEGLAQLMSLSILISGVGAPAQAILQRELRFRELGLVQFAGIVLGTGATTMVLALADKGPWALAYGSLANVTIGSAGCWWMLRDRWCISWHRTHMIRVGLVGVQMTLLRVLDVLWTQLPLVVAHAQLSSFDVGLYQRAQTLVDIGIQSTSARVNGVLLPVMASRQDSSEFLRDLVPPLVGLYSLFLLPVTAFVAVMASDIITFVLGAQWQSAAVPLVLIMIAFASLHVSQPASSHFEARAVFKPRIIGAGAGAAIVALFGWALVGKYGLTGISVAAVISGVVTAVINIAATIRHLGIATRSIFYWLAPSVGIAAELILALMACRPIAVHHVQSPAMRVAIMGALAGVVFVSGCRLLIGKTRGQMLSKYLSSGASLSTIAIAKLLGLQLQPPR